MILTAAFIISKAIGATWSWGWLFLTVMDDYSFRDNLIIRFKNER